MGSDRAILMAHVVASRVLDGPMRDLAMTQRQSPPFINDSRVGDFRDTCLYIPALLFLGRAANYLAPDSCFILCHPTVPRSKLRHLQKHKPGLIFLLPRSAVGLNGAAKIGYPYA